MSHADLTVESWYGLSDYGAVRVASAIAADNDLALVGAGYRTFLGERCRVAVFGRGEERFALVPGGRVRLGHDPGRFRPSAHQAADYAESAQEWDLPSLEDHLRAWTSPVREMDLPALLVAAQAVDLCPRPVAHDHPAVLDFLADHPPRWVGRAGLKSPDISLEVRFTAHGEIAAAHINDELTHADAVRRLADSGTRLPTPDEWEHACEAGPPPCSAGATTPPTPATRPSTGRARTPNATAGPCTWRTTRICPNAPPIRR